ncbi:MAG: hypothetical protein ACP5O3_03660 [Candidatus Micrarchaeia archaeon]
MKKIKAKAFSCIAVAFLLSLALSGCTQNQEQLTPAKEKQELLQACKTLCLAAKNSEGFTSGPCLTREPLQGPGGAWVCDVAHYPRQPVDDEPQNQCAAYRSGAAQHFIELSLDCEVIKEK